MSYIYLDPKCYNGVIPLVSTYNINTTTTLSFNEACIQRANELATKNNNINIMWSGGVDSSHVVAVFMLHSINCNLTITGNSRSVDEYPLMAELLKNNPDITYREINIDRNLELNDYILDDHINVYGDPEVHIIDVAETKTSRIRPYEKPRYGDWQQYYNTDEITQITTELEAAGVQDYIKSYNELTVYLEELHDIYESYIAIATVDTIDKVAPFYCCPVIKQSVINDARFWNTSSRPYKYIQKEQIYKLINDNDYYLNKTKRGSAGVYHSPSNTVYAITDSFELIADKSLITQQGPQTIMPDDTAEYD